METTLPDCDVMDAPYPIVYFYQGFGARAKDYYSYADRLSSWGYAVVQYNANTGERDDIEVGFFGDVLNHLKESSLSPYLDFDRIGTAGHSRGGRLAAMTMAQWQDVRFGILIDPVDDEYRTGSRSMDQVDYPVAIVSSSVASECVPTQLNYAIFFDKSAPGSWLQVIRDSGHSQFSLAADGFLQSQVDPCARGTRAIIDILELTYPTMVAWADYQLYGIGNRPYFDWVEEQEEKQFITWQEK